MTKYRLLGFFFHSTLRESFLVIFQITGDKSSVMKFIFKIIYVYFHYIFQTVYFIPRFSKRSLCVTGRTTASISSWICLSKPPMSLYCSVGLSSTSMAFTRESYSAGSVSRIRYESLLTPTRSPGLRVSASTRPMTGRK